MMNFHSIGGHRGFEGWWGMYVLKGAHYTEILSTRLRLSLYIVSRKGFSLGWPTKIKQNLNAVKIKPRHIRMLFLFVKNYKSHMNIMQLK